MLLIDNKYTGTAIIDSSGVYSFRDLVEKVKSFDSQIGVNLKMSQRVLLFSDYSFNSIALLIFLSRFPINIIPVVKTTQAELDEKVSVVSPDIIIRFGMNGELIIEQVKTVYSELEGINVYTNKGDTGIVLFSSGTTGKPKAMVQNFSELIRSIGVPKNQKRLIFLLLLMFDHIGGLNTLLNCLINGTPFVIPIDRNPSTILNLIEKYKVNVLPTTPTFLNLLLMDDSFSGNRLESLKLITYGTERMSDVLLNKIVSLLPNVKLLQTFGTSETGILKTESKSSSSLYFKITDEDKEYKIVNNELFLKSKTSVNGYLNHQSDSFTKDGWYATGDLVDIDVDGYIKIIGRKNKVINVGGLKVLPSEIEDLVNSIDGVYESTAFGEENSLVGNIVCLKVYTNNENCDELKLKIKKICKEQLDKYKVPVKIYFEYLTMNQRGKKNA